jgi:ATP-binding cassette subfamily B protein
MLRSTLSADAREQRKHRQKADLRTFKRIVLTYRPYRSQMFRVLIAVFAITALNLVMPLMLPLIFDDALTHRRIDHLILYALIIIIATLLSGLIGVGQTYMSNRVGQYVMRDMRNNLYSHLQNMSLRFFTSMPTGELQSRLSNDINGAQSAVTDTVTDTITCLVKASGAIVAMLYLSPLLTLTSLLFLPLFLFLTSKVGNMRRKSIREAQQSLASLTAWMQETLSVSSILLIKAFGRKKGVQSQFEVKSREFTELSIRQQMAGQWFFMIMSDFFNLMPVILSCLAGLLIIYEPGRNDMTLGKLIAFLAIQGSFFGPVNRLSTLLVNWQGSLALFDRLFEYLDLPVEIKDAPNALYLSPRDLRGEVTFKNVSFTYDKQKHLSGPIHPALIKKFRKYHANQQTQVKGITSKEAGSHRVLSNLSFTIKPGQLVALVGPSGAGKTTISYLIPRLYDVDEGAVEIDGYNVKKIALQTLGDLIGIVPQETYLFHASIRENLLYVCPEATEEEMIAATKAAAIHNRIQQLENGYDTIVGEHGYKLSGGEKQRLAIARVLLKNPKILILDEATSALDTVSERFIQDALKPLMKGRTTIAIAHRLSTIRAADLILVLDKGKIVEQGTHQKLLKRKGVYAQLYQQQFADQTQEEAAL